MANFREESCAWKKFCRYDCLYKEDLSELIEYKDRRKTIERHSEKDDDRII